MEEKKIAAGLFVLCSKTKRHLLLKRPLDFKYGGYWCSPGGHFDVEDVFPKATAIREFVEETDYKGKVKILKQPLIVEDDNHMTFYTFLGVVENEFVPCLKGEMEDGNEHDDYGWFDLDVTFPNIMLTTLLILKNKRDILDKVIKKFQDE